MSEVEHLRKQSKMECEAGQVALPELAIDTSRAFILSRIECIQQNFEELKQHLPEEAARTMVLAAPGGKWSREALRGNGNDVEQRTGRFQLKATLTFSSLKGHKVTIARGTILEGIYEDDKGSILVHDQTYGRVLVRKQRVEIL